MQVIKIVFAFLAVGGATYALIRLNEAPPWLIVVSFMMSFSALILALPHLPQAIDGVRESARKIAEMFPSPPPRVEVYTPPPRRPAGPPPSKTNGAASAKRSRSEPPPSRTRLYLADPIKLGRRYLPLHTAPDADAPTIDRIQAGARDIEALGPTAFCIVLWHKVTYRGQVGWVSAYYLERQN